MHRLQATGEVKKLELRSGGQSSVSKVFATAGHGNGGEEEGAVRKRMCGRALGIQRTIRVLLLDEDIIFPYIAKLRQKLLFWYHPCMSRLFHT